MRLTRRAGAFGHPAAARWILCGAKVHRHDPVAAIDAQHILWLAVTPRNAQACKVLLGRAFEGGTWYFTQY